MKATIIYTIICLFIINLIKVNNAQTLITSQNQAAIDLVKEAFGVTTTTPCNYLTCKLNTPSTTEYVVDSINVPTQSTMLTIASDLTVFKDSLTSLILGDLISLNVNFFNNLDKFFYINTIKVYSFTATTTQFSSSVVFPNSLQSIHFVYFGSVVGNNWFNSKLTSLIIENPNSGYNMSATIPTESNLIVLGLPVTLNGKLPSGLQNLVALNYLTLYVDNGETTTYAFPDLSVMKSISSFTSLVIRFVEPTSQQQWVFPSSTISTLTNLNNFEIYSNGFKLDTTLGYVDLSKFKVGSNLNFENNALQFIDSCTAKPCIKAPVGSQFISTGNNFKFVNMEFSNYASIYIQGNTIKQELPIGQFGKLETLEILDNTQLFGPLPNDYCYIKNLILSNNNLNGGVSNCFICQGGKFADNILPNPYSNFNANTLASCPTFKINSYNDIVNTDGSTIVTITGTDFGYDVNTLDGPKLKITIPNKEIQVSIPKGVLGSHSYKSTFQNGLYSFLFNYTYVESTTTTTATTTTSPTTTSTSNSDDTPSSSSTIIISFIFIVILNVVILI